MAWRVPVSAGVMPGEGVASGGGWERLPIGAVSRPKRKFNIDKVWACAAGSGLQLIKDEDRVFEERALPWDDPERLAGRGQAE